MNQLPPARPNPDPSPDQSPAENQPAPARPRSARLCAAISRARRAVALRSHLLLTTTYLAATTVVGVEVVASLLGLSALLPLTVPVLLVVLALGALLSRRFRGSGRHRRGRRVSG